MRDRATTSDGRFSAAYLAVGVAVIVAYGTVPGAPVLHAIAYDAVVAAGAVAIVVGIRRYRPVESVGWGLIAASVGLLAAGDVTWDIYEHVLHREVPLVSWADLFYLASYPFLVAGVIRLVRRRTGRDVEGSLDGVVAALAALVLLIEPLVRNRSQNGGNLAIAAAYVLADVAILGALTQLLSSRTRDITALLLGASLLSLAIGDIAFVWLGQSYEVSTWLDATWLFHSVAVGAAALHPSILDVDTRLAERPQRLTKRRLLVASIALVALPIDVVVNGDVEGVVGTLRLTARIAVIVAVVVRLLRLADTNERVEARLASVLESSGDPILYGDAEGNVEQCNPAAAKLFGDAVAPPADGRGAPFITAATIAALRDEPHVDVVMPGRRGDGSQFFVTARVSAMRGDQPGWVAVGRDSTTDLTTRLIATTVRGDESLESTLAEVVALTQDLLGFASIDVYEVIDDVRIRHLAGSSERARAVDWSVDDDTADQLEGGRVVLSERPDAGMLALIPVLQDHRLTLVVALEYAPGRPPAAATRAVLDDLATAIGQTLRTAVAFARERDVAQQLQDMERQKSDFFRMIGHELRAPIAAITAGADVLAGDKTGAGEVHPMLATTLAESARGLDRLITDLVSAVQGPDGSFRCTLNLVEQPSDVISRAVESVAPPGRVVLDVEALPPIMSDADRLRQLLVNLVTNALKFSPSSTPVTVRAWREDNALRISVADQGCGIQPDEMPQLFRRFSRLPPRPGAAEVSGTGLGLFISRGIATAHGGDLWAESDGVRGSVFHVRLPLAPKEVRDHG